VIVNDAVTARCQFVSGAFGAGDLRDPGQTEDRRLVPEERAAESDEFFAGQVVLRGAE
jgi:hypothetical protein